jgi:hypothetical protein
MSSPARVPATRNAAAAEASIAAAAELGLALWCDDNVLRQRARGRGVPSFSVLDLTTAMRARGADIDAEDELHLAAQGVADMPLTGPALIDLATGNNWQMGAAHAALARPGWWAIHNNDGEPLWHQLAAAAAAHSPDALTLITRAAIAGATLHTPPGQHTQRYQQLASLAIVACRTAGQPVPAGFLATLAQGAPAQIVPQPQHIRTAVADELASQGVPDAEAVAIELLPEANLT